MCVFIFTKFFSALFQNQCSFQCPGLLLCPFVLPWILLQLLISQDDEIRAVSTFFSVALVTAALATSGFLQRSGCSFPCLHVLLCSCKLQAEGQGISVDLTLASPPSLILAICWMSELINLYHNHLRASDLSC